MSSPPVLSRRDRERSEHRRAMLAAALAVFGAKGYDGATLDEVAELAEFGKGTLYNYFPEGKDELYFALFDEHVLGGMTRAVDAAIPDLAAVATPAGARLAFRRMLEGLLAYFEANQSVLLLFVRDGHRLLADARTRAHLAGGFARVMDAVERPVAAAVAAGALRPLPTRAITHMLLGSVRGYLIARVDALCAPEAPAPPGFDDPAHAAAFLTTVLFDGLLADPA